MNEEIIITAPEEADLNSAYEVFEKSIRDAFVCEGLHELKEMMYEEIEYKKKLLMQSVEDSDSENMFLLAKRGDLVIGTISYGPIGKEIRDCTGDSLGHLGELGSLYVLPEYQNRGAGSLLIKALANHLTQSGIEEFCLDSGYKRAQKRWKTKFGQPYRIVRDYWGEGSDHMIWVCRSEDYSGD